MKRFLQWLLAGACLLTLPLRGAEYWVSPEATTAGNGSGTLASPGSLLTACAHTGWASSIGAGDTIWLKGGLYQSPATFNPTNYWEWVVTFSGATNNPVTWRSASNEWAVVDGCWEFDYQHFHRFRNVELLDSHKANHVRWTEGGEYVRQGGPWGHFQNSGFAGDFFEYINVVIHDTRLVWGAGNGWKVRGCVIWNVGQNGLEHIEYNASKYMYGNVLGWTAGTIFNFSGDNQTVIASNVVFGAYDRVGRFENNDFTIVGNRFYPAILNGTICTLDLRNGSYTVTNNTIIGDGWPAKIKDNPLLVNRFNTWMMANGSQGFPLLENQGTTGFTGWDFDYNGYYARSPQSPIFREAFAGQPETNNAFSGWRSTYPGLDANSSAPGGLPPDSVNIITNFDQPKRAHIAVYNWSRKDNVSVDVSSVLQNGEPYRLWSAQDFNKGPILTGTLSGGSISIPMTNLTTARWLYGTNSNWVNPDMNPEFGAFVLIGPNDPADPYPGGGSILDTNPPVQPPANNAPNAQADSYSVVLNNTLNIAAAGVLTNDSDSDGDSLTASLVSDVSHGTLTLNEDGSFSYAPTTDYTGPDSFTYRAYDGQDYSAAATVSLTVSNPESGNTAPTGNPDSYSLTQDTTLTVDAPGVLANDLDADEQSLSAEKASDPAHGTLSLNADGSFTYAPTAGYYGSDSFWYRASDGTDYDSVLVSLTITQASSPAEPPNTNTPPTGPLSAPLKLRSGSGSYGPGRY